MLLRRLEKLASTGAKIRSSFEKRALLGAAAKAAIGAGRAVGGWAVKNPGKALVGGLGAAGAASAVPGKFKQYKAGFDPGVQRAMMGQTPVPPGAQ